MRQVIGDKSAIELLNELRTLDESEAIQEGERTLQQWAKEWGLGRFTTTRLLTSGIKAGKIQKRSAIITVGGHNRRATVYRRV
jgi:hypothetical protein